MIYITGDTHADIRRFNNPVMKKLKENDIVIVCGDFGFLWNDSDEERKILDKLSNKRFTIAFVDGCHENFDLIKSYPTQEFCGGKVHKIRKNIYHLIRGEVFEIQGKKIFAMGGGESEDIEERDRVGKWWVDEVPSKECLDIAKKNLEAVQSEVDYIITHQPPIEIGLIINQDTNNVNVLTIFLEDIAKSVRYRKWFFGSLHIDRKVSGKYYSVFDSIVPVEPIERKTGIFSKIFGRK